MRRNWMTLTTGLGLLLVAGLVAAAQQAPQGGAPAGGARPAAPQGGAAPAAAPQGAGGGPGGMPGGAPPPPLRLMSADVTDGTQLAAKFTCTAGADAISPGLRWVQAPRDTASFALIVHDMEPRPRKANDDILHWMVWNLPATANQLPQGIPSNIAELPDGSYQTNGNPGQGGVTGYRPPCPPQNVPVAHHYAFELYALDTKVNLPPTATRADLMKAMDGHISAHASIVAPFNR
jgi:Raf kinase inhibitor-like YbhB/YbcL family protein